MKRVYYIGVLGIAGFKSFDYNGFDKICIIYANEKLQQFLNQHMLTLEQEECVREGLDYRQMLTFGWTCRYFVTCLNSP